jgi:prephenate dehydratase
MTKPKIAFQGELGANSDEACRTHFPSHEPMPCATFEEAFEAVKTGAAELAMIPVENSIAGRVADVHHLLPSSGLYIVGERFKSIRFQLMVNPGTKLEDVKVAASMPFALFQCRNTLNRLGVKLAATSDTAGAAKELAEHPDPHKAAVSPRLAAEIYGLDILLQDIEDVHNNTTRFIVLSRAMAHPRREAACITSFLFRVRNIPAALYKALGGFATNGVNMTKLESYMEDGRFTATLFYAEVDGRPEDQHVARAIEELSFFSERFELLGVFEADPLRADLLNGV